MISHKYFTVFISVALCLVSCSHKSSVGEVPLTKPERSLAYDYYTREIKTLPLDSVTVSQYNRFAYDFLTSAVEASDSPNMLVSPLSLEMLLSLLANGADKPALTEILDYMNMPSLKTLNDMNRS